MNLRLAPLLLLPLLPLVMGSSKKQPYSVTFHAQAEESDPRKTVFPLQLQGRMMLFKLVAEVSDHNFVAFHPFDSESGNGRGVAFQLDFRGRNSLEMATRQRQGEVLVAMVNGQPVDYLVIDQVIADGLITVWQGVPDEVILQMDKKLPRIRPGGPPTMNKDLDMVPTTKKDKKRSFLDWKKEEKAREKGTLKEEEIPKLDLPSAPTTNKIPIEGAGPAIPAAPLPEPALPQR